MDAATKEFFKPLEARLEKEAIKYKVQKQMFCPKTGEILDYRTCILIEITVGGTYLAGQVMSPFLAPKLEEIKANIHKQLPNADISVAFKTLNKKLNNPLLTLIK